MIVDVRNPSRRINVVSDLHMVILHSFSATPNAPMSGAGARSAEASAPLAGWAAAILLFELSELP